MRRWAIPVLAVVLLVPYALADEKTGWTTPTWSQPFCKIHVERVYQPQDKARIHVVVLSDSDVDISFSMSVTGHKGTLRETQPIIVKLLTPGAKIDEPTRLEYNLSSIETVSLTLNSCIKM